MKIENNIGWCDITGNPGIGCRGCELGDDCYALNDTPARVLRAGAWPGHVGEKIETFGKDRVFVPTKKGLSDLRRLNKLCICDTCSESHPIKDLGTVCDWREGDKDPSCGGVFRRIRFFADSNSDFMDWPIEILAQALDEIRLAPNVNVILLTKWPELFNQKINAAIDCANDETAWWLQKWDEGKPPQNVWILTSVLGNALDEKRIANVLKIPAAVRGLSCEPLWAKPDLLRLLPVYSGDEGTNSYDNSKINWVIVGCDSSKHRKGWNDYEANARSIIEVGHMAGIPVYHKQMPVNGKVSLKLSEFQNDLQCRQFPK